MRFTVFSVAIVAAVLIGRMPAFGFDQTKSHTSRPEPQEQQLTEHRHYENADHDLVHHRRIP